MGQEKLWTRTLIVLMGVNFCSALSFYLIMVKVTEFAIDTYGVTHSVAGSLITVYVISALITRLLFGGKIDAWGVKRALVVGSAVNAVAMALYIVPMEFAALMVVRVIHGFGFAIMSGSAAAGAALVIPRSRYGEGIGYFSMMQALATGIGPFVAILITSVSEGYVPMFVFAAIVALLALASLALLKIPPTAHVITHHKASQGDAESSGDAADGGDGNGTSNDASASADTEVAGAQGTAASKAKRGIGSFIQLSVVPLASVLFLCYLCYSGILSFVTLYADSLGFTDAVSLYFVVYAAAILVSRPPVGRRVDRLGENSIIYACFVSLAIGFVLLAFSLNGIMLLVSAAFIGFGIGAVQSIVQAVIARDTPPNELGKANSTFFMSMDFGSGVGPIIIGAAIPFIGYNGSYLALAAVAVLAGVVYHAVHGRHR